MHYFVKALAAAALVAALATGPAAPAWADDYSKCNRGSGNSAIAACSRLIGGGQLKGRNLAAAYFKRGFNHGRKRHYNRAIADYTRAIELKPNYADAYNSRGVVYAKKRQYDRAIADYTKAIALGVKFAGLYNNRAAAYMQKRQYDRAIADYTMAIKRKPNSATAYRGRGFAYWQKRQNRRAIADFRTAVRLDPKDDYSRKSLKSLGATP